MTRKHILYLCLPILLCLYPAAALAEITTSIVESRLNNQTGSVIEAGPGRAIKGVVRVDARTDRIFREHTGLYYASWQDGYNFFAQNYYGPTGVLDIAVDLTAPDEEGTYYIVFFYDAADAQGTWSNAASMDPRRHFDLGRAVKVVVREGAGGPAPVNGVEDDFKNAEPVAMGSTVSGRVSGDHTDDWYRVIPEQAGVVSFFLEVDSNDDLRMSVYGEDASGKFRVLAEDQNSRDFSLRLETARDAEYYVRVQAPAGNAGEYRLRPAMSVFDRIESQDRIEGSLNFLLNAEDVFLLETAQSGTQRFELTVEEERADLDLYVLDEAGNEVARSVNERGAERLEFEAEKDRSYFVHIKVYNLWSITDYVLTSSFQQSAGTEKEKRDTARIGDRLVGEVAGSDPERSEQWYTVAIPKNGILTLVLDRLAENEDLELELYNPDGDRVAESDESAGSDETISVYVKGGNDMKYRIRVFAYSEQDASSYRLSLSFSEEEKEATEGGKIEGGNSRARATEIELRRRYQDSVDYEGDVNDWYVLRADRDGPLTVRLELEQKTARINFALISAKGEQLAVFPAYNDVMDLTVRAERDERIYVWVWPAGWNQATAFTLLARPSEGMSNTEKGVNFEAGRQAATEIRPGLTEYRDRLTGPDDAEDWWYVRLQETADLLVWIRGEGEPKDMTLEVYDEKGNLIQRSATRSKTDENLIIPNAEADRRYIIRVLLEDEGEQRYVLNARPLP